MGSEFSTLHAADLAVQLPRGSRVWCAKNPDSKWTDELLFLNSIEFRLRCIEYGLSGKGKPPKPIYNPKTKKKASKAMDVDSVAAILSLPRE